MNIDSIIVGERQRKSLDNVDEAFVSSVKKHLIHPIVIRRGENNEPILVAGGRRLAALQKAGITDLEENKHFRYIEDLSPTEAKILELEENVKRTDLSWREHAEAAGKIHELYVQTEENWSIAKTAKAVNLSQVQLGQILTVYKNLDSPALRDSQSINQSYSILQTIAERRAAAIVSQINSIGTEIFNESKGEGSLQTESSDDNGESAEISLEYPTSDGGSGIQNEEHKTVSHGSQAVAATPMVICVDFTEWIKDYSGKKFNLIHCDFPYDIKYDSFAKSLTSSGEDYDFSGFFPLLDCLCDNIDKIASYSSHIMFWFSMKFYQRTKERLESAGLFVHDHPLIWHKTDNAGIVPGRDGIFPRRVYETAFLCTRGKRPLIKASANAYGAPMTSNPIHPSQKPEPVLWHFFGMLVDETTDMFDPTCGSGSSLRAADHMGARSVLGLEISQTHASAANAATITAHNLRKVTKQ